ncbi:hypothetical protein Y032_0025g1131 [Ancylostoma ceylanicum]|uniref:Uncharacterized protein n=1 Tax=Ancylostoma ceylanicum TaxID=53326 RepID=A0A016UWE0_9BILA|nr:hypothetical protein Y032_0025g1131 [Ancylostoma ceylanicum]
MRQQNGVRRRKGPFIATGWWWYVFSLPPKEFCELSEKGCMYTRLKRGFMAYQETYGTLTFLQTDAMKTEVAKQRRVDHFNPGSQ